MRKKERQRRSEKKRKTEKERETEKGRETERKGVSVIIQGLFIRLPKQYRLERWYLGYNHSDTGREWERVR